MVDDPQPEDTAAGAGAAGAGAVWPSPGRPVTGLASDYPAGHEIPPHSHPWAQLLFAATGAMWVTTEAGTFVVPTSRAVWVPARMPHRLRMTGAVAMRALFVAADRAVETGLPDACRVVEVGPLLRALILRLHALQGVGAEGAAGVDDDDGIDVLNMERRELVSRLILLELRAVDAVPLYLPQPRDPRLRALCARLLADPGCLLGLEALATEAGASARTVARLFRQETGMRFTDWRQQLRLAAALTLLADGKSGKAVARALGFRSASAFTAAFRRSLGRPPTAFLQASDDKDR